MASRWDWRVILLHWLSATCVLLAFASMWSLDWVEDRGLRAVLLGMHRTAGLLAIGLAVLRLATRSVVAAPVIDLPSWQALLARATHGALYILLLGQPLLGWAYSSARGQDIRLFGLLPVPPLPGFGLALGRGTADLLRDAHGLAGNLLLALIGAHAAAALYHGLLRRDGVLQAMLPVAAGVLPPLHRDR